jgi:hypothetical protein
VKRICDVAGRTALVAAALAIGLSGCSALSPSTITETYPASDGTNADLPGTAVALRNFLVIGAEKGAPAELVGAVINDGATAAIISITADLGQTAQPTPTVIQIGAHSSVQIGPEQKFTLSIPALPVEPGATTALSAATSTGGHTDITVPVLRPEDEYTQITPAPTTEAPTPTPTKKSKKTSGDATSTQSPSETVTPTTTETTN